MPVFVVTYLDGSAEQIEADEFLERGKHLTFVNHRILFVSSVYNEIALRVPGREIDQVDEMAPPSSGQLR